MKARHLRTNLKKEVFQTEQHKASHTSLVTLRNIMSFSQSISHRPGVNQNLRGIAHIPQNLFPNNFVLSMARANTLTIL